MKWHIIGLPIMFALAGCHEPLTSLDDANGCYYENGPSWLFRLDGNRVIDPGKNLIATASLAEGKLTLIPGIRITDDVHKATMVVSGTDIGRLVAWRQGAAVHLVGFDTIGAEKFDRRPCN